MMVATQLYGMTAEFDDPHHLVSAAYEARRAGYTKMDAYTPQPVEGLAEALNLPRSRVPLIVLVGGLTGATAGILLQYWVSVIAYPINVGGRPLASWPMFVPVTFEMTILFSSLAAVVGMIAVNGLPMPYHPIFNAKHFERASQDGFFLCIEATDPLFDPERTREFLQSLHPREVADVTY